MSTNPQTPEERSKYLQWYDSPAGQTQRRKKYRQAYYQANKAKIAAKRKEYVKTDRGKRAIELAALRSLIRKHKEYALLYIAELS